MVLIWLKNTFSLILFHSNYQGLIHMSEPKEVERLWISPIAFSYCSFRFLIAAAWQQLAFSCLSYATTRARFVCANSVHARHRLGIGAPSVRYPTDFPGESARGAHLCRPSRCLFCCKICQIRNKHF